MAGSLVSMRKWHKRELLLLTHKGSEFRKMYNNCEILIGC